LNVILNLTICNKLLITLENSQNICFSVRRVTENRCSGGLATRFFRFCTVASRSRPLRKTSSRVWTPDHPPPHPHPTPAIRAAANGRRRSTKTPPVPRHRLQHCRPHHPVPTCPLTHSAVHPNLLFLRRPLRCSSCSRGHSSLRWCLQGSVPPSFSSPSSRGSLALSGGSGGRYPARSPERNGALLRSRLDDAKIVCF
jgi:hypothetical protein